MTSRPVRPASIGLAVLLGLSLGWAHPGEAVDDAPFEAAACGSSAAALLSDRPFPFRPGAADLAPGSEHLVVDLARIAARCPDSLVAVTVHADPVGAADRSLSLALARARVLVDALVANGLPAERFTALGYARTDPRDSKADGQESVPGGRIDFMFRD